jgi:2'-5' RNA ligase
VTPAAEGNASRRLFFALWPDEPTRQQLLRETRRLVRRCQGKPVPPENYHVTVAFVGTVPAERFDAIAAAGRATEFAQFELLFERVGYWPRPRVLWVAPSRCPPALNTLVSMLWDRLSDAGLEREARAYQPHLTLCRKLGRPIEARLANPVRWSVSSFVLVESVVVDGRSIYQVMERFPQ